MSLKKKFILNTAIISASKVIESLISFLIIILISRELGAEGLGQYSFIFGFVGIFFILSDWGLNAMMVKDLSKNFSKVDKYISNIFTTKVILGVLSFLFYFVALFFIGESDLFWHLVFAGLIQLMQIIYSIGLNILRIKSEGLKIATADMIERGIAVVGAVVVFSLTQSLLWFIIVLFFSNLIRAILLFVVSKKYYKIRLGIDFKFIFSLIRQGFPFLLIGTFTLIYSRMDTIMLKFMQTYEVVGWYNAGYKLIDVLAIVPTLLLMFGFPMMSKLIYENKTAARALFENLIYYSLILVLPIATGIYFVGDRILEFVYGFGAPESFLAFQVLGFGLIFIYVSSISGYMLGAGNKQKLFAWIGGIGAGINIILNFALIPKYSLYGAATATLITYALMMIAMLYMIRKHFFKYKIKLLAPIAATTAMALLLKFTNIQNTHLFIIIATSAIIYATVLLVLDESLLKELFT